MVIFNLIKLIKINYFFNLTLFYYLYTLINQRIILILMGNTCYRFNKFNNEPKSDDEGKSLIDFLSDKINQNKNHA